MTILERLLFSYVHQSRKEKTGMTRYVPARYVTAPVTVDAIQYKAANCASVHAWIGQPHFSVDDENNNLCGTSIYISKDNIAFENDWICQNHSQFFVVSDAMFAAAFKPLYRTRKLRKWIVTAVATMAEGRVVTTKSVSEHFTVWAARRAVAKYSTMKNPNPHVLMHYQIDHAGTIPQSDPRTHDLAR